MQLQPSRSKVRGTSTLRVILALVAIGLATHLAFRVRDIWTRLIAKPAIIKVTSGTEAAATNAPSTRAANNLPLLQPAPAMASAPLAPPEMVALEPPKAGPAAPAAVSRPSAGDSGGGSPRGYGTIGFPPRTTPVVLYQPGTLTFVSIPIDVDDVTTRPNEATNQIDRLKQHRTP